MFISNFTPTYGASRHESDGSDPMDPCVGMRKSQTKTLGDLVAFAVKGCLSFNPRKSLR